MGVAVSSVNSFNGDFCCQTFPYKPRYCFPNHVSVIIFLFVCFAISFRLGELFGRFSAIDAELVLLPEQRADPHPNNRRSPRPPPPWCSSIPQTRPAWLDVPLRRGPRRLEYCIPRVPDQQLWWQKKKIKIMSEVCGL